MTNQRPPSGWNPPQQGRGNDVRHGASAPSAQYGAPQRPQGYSTAPPQGYPAPRPQRPPTESIAVGPFTLRELIIFIAAFLLLVCSFLPMMSGTLGSGTNLWNPIWPLVVPGALLPVAAAVLVLIRRLAPTVPLRVGSLSVDQFASVVAVISAATYLGVIVIVLGIGAAVGSGFGLFSASLSFGPLLGILFALVLVVVTTFGPLIPPFAADFRGRPSVTAHASARPVTPVPRAPRPAPAPAYGPGGFVPQASAAGSGQPAVPYQQTGQAAPQNAPGYQQGMPVGSPSVQHTQVPFTPPIDSSAYVRPSEPATQDEQPQAPQHNPVEEARSPQPEASHGTAAQAGSDSAPPVGDDTRSAAGAVLGGDDTTSANSNEAMAPVTATEHVNGSSPRAAAPFWVWSPRPRSVIDEATHSPVFEIGPDAWALAVDDRGSSLVIRHDDGRVGILHDVNGLTRG